jgi:Family of unknown function (DUF5681)
VSHSSDDDNGGYGRPPKKTRYQKGQSGNSNPRYSRRRRSAVEWLEELLLKPVEITLAGETKKIATLEAIVTRISLKALAGDRRAQALLWKFAAFAARNSKKRVEIVFVDDDYTQALAAQAPTGGPDNE